MEGHKSLHERGFTLIELVVVVSMLVLVMGGLVASNSSARQIQNLDAAANLIVSSLREAQAMGQSGRAFGTDPNIQFDRGYGVYVTRAAGGAEDNRKIVIYGGDGTTRFSSCTGSFMPKCRAADGYRDEGSLTSDKQFVEQSLFPPGVIISDLGKVGATDIVRLHILFRRGDPEAIIHYQNFDSYLDSAEITLKNGAFERKVVINKYGLIYTE